MCLVYLDRRLFSRTMLSFKICYTNAIRIIVTFFYLNFNTTVFVFEQFVPLVMQIIMNWQWNYFKIVRRIIWLLFVPQKTFWPINPHRKFSHVSNKPSYLRPSVNYKSDNWIHFRSLYKDQFLPEPRFGIWKDRYEAGNISKLTLLAQGFTWKSFHFISVLFLA